MSNIDIVLGTSFGDEGKGKVIYSLLQHHPYDLCIRFNGSCNAGHTIYHHQQKIILHQIPIGILFPHVQNLIASDCLIDLPKLKNEIQSIQSLGISIHNRLFISKACHIITQESIDYDRTHNKIGTTGSGIGPTYSLKMLRTGKRVEDFQDEFDKLGIVIVDMRKWWKNHTKKNILLEGAQGFELDINWTNHYPYCTSSSCTLGNAINTGIQIKDIRNIYGVAKVYDTYVGTMKFQPDDDPNLEKLGEIGQEFGSTTGRKRQCNYLNLDSLIEALTVNNCTICILNKCDVLQQTNTFRLYYEDELQSFSTWSDMKSFLIEKLSQWKVIFSSSPFTIYDEQISATKSILYSA